MIGCCGNISGRGMLDNVRTRQHNMTSKLADHDLFSRVLSGAHMTTSQYHLAIDIATSLNESCTVCEPVDANNTPHLTSTS